jgi:hypothetical protein
VPVREKPAVVATALLVAVEGTGVGEQSYADVRVLAVDFRDVIGRQVVDEGGGNAEVPDQLLPGREVARRLRELRHGSVQQLQQQAGQLGGALAIVAAQRAGQRFPHRVDRMDGFAQRHGPVLGE